MHQNYLSITAEEFERLDGPVWSHAALEISDSAEKPKGSRTKKRTLDSKRSRELFVLTKDTPSEMSFASLLQFEMIETIVDQGLRALRCSRFALTLCSASN
jgi:hypothetical protein